jgi:hypothetical protein
MAEERRETERAVAHWQRRIAQFGYPPLSPEDREFDDLIAEGGAYRFVISVDRAGTDDLFLTYGPRFARLLDLPTRAGLNIRLVREIPKRLLPAFIRGCRAAAKQKPPVKIEGAISLRDGRNQFYRAVFMPIGANLVFGAFNSRLVARNQRSITGRRSFPAEREAIAAFIGLHGVTRCPTAFVAPTHGTISAADQEAPERHMIDLESLRRQRQNAISDSSP